jgi:hypothetical protein
MGYSARYHAASLAAVFLALAIGIVIGVGLGQDVIASSTESLEESLQEDVEEARSELEEREEELEREREFGQSAYPVLVGDRLAGERVGIVALGSLGEEIADDIEAALAPTGATIRKVAVVALPPDLVALADAREARRFDRLGEDAAGIEALGRTVGRQLVRGGPLLLQARDQLLERFSGDPGAVERVIVVRQPPGDIDPAAQEELALRFEEGLLGGLAAAPGEVVGVERSDAERSDVPLFEAHDIPTSDSVDLTAGKVAMVFALLGAEGHFGIKETADRLLPDLLPPGPAPLGEPSGGGARGAGLGAR